LSGRGLRQAAPRGPDTLMRVRPALLDRFRSTRDGAGLPCMMLVLRLRPPLTTRGRGHQQWIGQRRSRSPQDQRSLPSQARGRGCPIRVRFGPRY
jgi:hypothetical protein